MRIGFISDIHEDLKSLTLALSLLEKKRCEEIICLGDISGYSFPFFHYEDERDASACLDLVRQSCSVIIIGNHDLFACRKIPRIRGGFTYPENWYEIDFQKREELSGGRVWLYEDTELKSNLTDDDIHYLRSLPEYFVMRVNGFRILFSHYLFDDLSGSTTRMLPDIELQNSHFGFMQDNDCDLSFFGHVHVEGLWAIRNGNYSIRKKVNVNEVSIAAVGVPCLSRGRNAPGCAIFDSGKGIIESHPIYNRFRRNFMNI